MGCVGFSLVEASRGLFFTAVRGLLIAVAPLVASTGSRGAGFSSCSMRAQELWLAGSRAQAQLWHTEPAALQHVASSRTRDQTHVPGAGRRILFFLFSFVIRVTRFIMIFTLLQWSGNEPTITRRYAYK